MLPMVSYPHRPQSGHITCYLNRTYHVLPTEKRRGAWQVGGDRIRYAFSSDEDCCSMTNRVTYGPQDFQKMCRQAERDHEGKKLAVLMERVKKQIAERQKRGLMAELPATQ